MTSSLVGSEMCIRDRATGGCWRDVGGRACGRCARRPSWDTATEIVPVSYTHLTLADDMQCVDLG
eukprot:6637803-Prorocentrum_lima.AAC.1